MSTKFTSLAIACWLAGSGCKADSKASAPGSADTTETATPTTQGSSLPKGRSGKIDLGPRPSLPPSSDGSAAADSSPGPDQERPRPSRMAGIDTDGDGKISDAERAASRRQRAERMHEQLDANKDGKLSVEELAASPFKRFDPAVVDTNKDGDITIEELDKALDQRKGPWKSRDSRPWRTGSGGSRGSAPAP
jgi:hypothetical protein